MPCSPSSFLWRVVRYALATIVGRHTKLCLVLVQRSVDDAYGRLNRENSPRVCKDPTGTAFDRACTAIATLHAVLGWT